MIYSLHNHAGPGRAIKSLLLSAILLTLCACATQAPPLFFPAEPAPPRIQLLTAFNNTGSLRDNKMLQFIVGDDYTNQFAKAYGLDFYQGRLYVADGGKANPGIAVVDFTDRTIKRYTDGVTKPMNLDVDSDGTVYICDLAAGSPAIKVFDNKLRFMRSIVLDIDGFRPADVLVIGDKLYVADVRLNRIRVLNKQTGEILQTLGQGAKLGWPVNLSLTPDGNIIVTETGAQRLRVMSQSGEMLAEIGEPGDRAGNFGRPKATAVDHDGNIYAVDVAFQNVQVFDPQGKILMYFGKTGNKDSLVMPAGIAITYDNLAAFQPYAAPGFVLEYVVAVSSQGGPPNFGSKISLYGFGKKSGADYTIKKPE